MHSKNTTFSLKKWRNDRKTKTILPFLGAVGVQFVLLTLTIFVVVLVPKPKEEPAFKAHKTVYLPQKEIEHRINQAAFEQIASPAMVMDRLKVSDLTRQVPVEFPSFTESPAFNLAECSSINPSHSLLSSASMSDLVRDLPTSNSAVSFFGIQESAKRVVVAFDVSLSVLNKAEKSGVSINRIKDEARQLLEGLGPNTYFGVIQFIRRYEFFRPDLIPASKGNKRLAQNWLDKEFRTSGRTPLDWIRLKDEQGRPRLDGIQAVVEEIFKWEPDVVFILSDGGFGRNFPSKTAQIDLGELGRDLVRLQSQQFEKTRIHFVGFEVRKERGAELKKIIRRYGGEYRSF